MSIRINKLHRMDGYHDRHFGTVTHNGNTCDAILVGPFDRLQSLLNTDISAEYELNEIIAVEVNLPRDNSVSGIYALPDGQVAVDGTVHNETKIDENLSLFDISIEIGADFFAVSTEDIQQRPKVGTRIRIIGKGLRVYPTFT